MALTIPRKRLPMLPYVLSENQNSKWSGAASNVRKLTPKSCGRWHHRLCSLREASMTRLSFVKELSANEVEMKELEFRPARWSVCRSFLFSVAFADVAATTMMLLGN
jgi:hypothetical protein